MLTLVIANLKMLARNRQATFWAILFPLLLVVAFGLFDINNVGSGNLVVVDLDGGPRAKTLQQALGQVEILDLESLDLKSGQDAETEARLKVSEKDLDYLVIIPPGFEDGDPEEESQSPARITLVYNSRDRGRNQLVDALIRSLVAETQPENNPLPISQILTTQVIEVPEVDYFDEVLKGLIGLGIMTNSIISIAVRVSTFRNQSILKRLLVTPLPIWKYFAGEILAHLVLAAIQVAIFLAVGVFAFGASIHGNVGWIFVIALLGTVVFLNIGFILSAWARSPAAASALGNLVALPMMFFAGAFFSTATLPWVLPEAARVLPLTPMLEALRDVAIDSAPLWETWPQLGAMGIWVAVTALIASRVFRFS
ncbi:MAG TPA: ABC transporter permease [Dehalococcoidia bacterium]|nr:ABC transporter permease [Dehalococcoidia bacterium]